MSVISRLDEQADALLITPLKRKGEAQATTRAETNKQTETADEQPHRAAPHYETSAQRAAQTELPVWLL